MTALALALALLPWLGDRGRAETIFVSNEKGNSITVLDAATLTVQKTIPVGQRPRGIVLSKDNNTLYICAIDDDEIDFSTQFSVPFPSQVFLTLLGLAGVVVWSSSACLKWRIMATGSPSLRIYLRRWGSIALRVWGTGVMTGVEGAHYCPRGLLSIPPHPRAGAPRRQPRRPGGGSQSAAAPGRCRCALPQPQAEAAAQFLRETTAAAIALLDAQCPWLRGAEQRFSPRSPRAACSAVVLRSEA